MKFHIENPRPHIPFTPYQFINWVEQQKPSQIELTDRQYSVVAQMMGRNDRMYCGIPIVFADAPTI